MLYVEGPRDREVLSAWSKRAEPGLARLIEDQAFILGGRQPARALADFRKRGGAAAGWRGLIVLDRDDEDASAPSEAARGLDCEGLELFVWGQRHIESYLLVPETLRRLVGNGVDERRIAAALAGVGRNGELDAPVHAKRSLGVGGELSALLGVSLRAGEIARAMRREEIHPDVHTLFQRIGAAAGVERPGPEVVLKPPRR